MGLRASLPLLLCVVSCVCAGAFVCVEGSARVSVLFTLAWKEAGRYSEGKTGCLTYGEGEEEGEEGEEEEEEGNDEERAPLRLILVLFVWMLVQLLQGLFAKVAARGDAGMEDSDEIDDADADADTGERI